MTRLRGLVVLALVAALAVAGCYAPDDFASGEGSSEWTYVEGPNGEHCLLLSRWIGSQSGLMAMHCDSVNWEARP